MNSPSERKALNSSSNAVLVKEDQRHPAAILRRAAAFLKDSGVEAPRLCAELLLAHALHCERADLYIRPHGPVPDEPMARFQKLLHRRARHEPVQYLTGRAEFWSLSILCDRRALIPRPETELIVEEALRLCRTKRAPVIADIGTGTGCIAIALARELIEARVYASDISPQALELAAANVEEHRLGKRIELLEGDLAAPFLAAGLTNGFDLIVCNPPYVSEGEVETLQAEVRDYEPRQALVAGADGLAFVGRFFLEAGALLKRDGSAIIEIADGRAEAVRGLARDAGWHTLRIRKDAAGIERTFVGRRLNHGHV